MGRGEESAMPAVITDGLFYYCTDSGRAYIDWLDESGDLFRSAINADCASKLRYSGINGEYVEVDIVEYINTVIDSLRQEILGGEW